jgi:hypothetical protein
LVGVSIARPEQFLYRRLENRSANLKCRPPSTATLFIPQIPRTHLSWAVSWPLSHSGKGSRIGCIGHSLGAKEVLYAMAFEPRYQVGVFNEGDIGLRMSNWTDPWYLTDAMKPHIPAMEHHQVLALIAPRPFLVLGGDDADGKASWAFVKEARSVYALLGVGDRIGRYNHRAGHSFPPAARQVAYQWLDRWLKGGSK